MMYWPVWPRGGCTAAVGIAGERRCTAAGIAGEPTSQYSIPYNPSTANRCTAAGIAGEPTSQYSIPYNPSTAKARATSVASTSIHLSIFKRPMILLVYVEALFCSFEEYFSIGSAAPRKFGSAIGGG